MAWPLLLAVALAAAPLLVPPAAAAPAAGGLWVPQGAGVADVHVWRAASSSSSANASAGAFVYPELSPDGAWGMPGLQARPNLGVCFSGGGMRATVAALGWARALWGLGVLQRSRYLATNSGGSWFGGAFSYTQVPVPQFLGPYVAPKDLTKKELRTLPAGSYGAACAAAAPVNKVLAQTAADTLLRPAAARAGLRAWTDAVSQTFLAPFGVGGTASSVTALGTRGRVHERVAASAPGCTLLTACTQARPFPILLGSAIFAEDPRVFFPVEFTPLYTGSAALAADVRYSAVPGALALPYGGGLVEPLGFNSWPPPPLPAALPAAKGAAARLGAPAATRAAVPLAQAVGISSAFVAQKTKGGKQGREVLLSVEQLAYWNLQDGRGAPDVKFGDGGGHDNQAITPLLRRGVRRVVAGSATSCNASASRDAYAACQYDLSGLFGAVPLGTPPIDGAVPPRLYNGKLQVFPRAGWDEFHALLRKRLAAGAAPAFAQTLRVLPNAFLGVSGGYDVRVVWLLNHASAQWEAALPAETRKILERSRAGDNAASKLDELNPLTARSLKDFPEISTFETNFSPEVVQALSQFASWSALQVADELRQLLAA